MTVRPRNAGLFPSVEDDLAALSAFVAERCLTGVDDDWDEVVREYGDDRAYLTLCLTSAPGASAPSVRIEVGVQDATSRHATGGLVGVWSRARREIDQVELVLLDGRSANVALFVDRLRWVSGLPLTASEEAVAALAA